MNIRTKLILVSFAFQTLCKIKKIGKSLIWNNFLI